MLDRTIAYGLDFLFPVADAAVGASLRNHGEFGRVEVDFFVEMAGEPATFIDVGANIGAIALPFAKARPDWTVIAVEAHRGLAGLLAANSLNNQLYNVEVIQAAAGAERRLAEFPAAPLSARANFGMLGFTSDTGATETVRMLTLDEVAPTDTRMIKIDVEGFEPEVLKGAAKLLEARQAVWLAEATVQNPAATAQVIETFLAAGYGVYWFYAPFVTHRAAKAPPTEALRGDSNVVALPPGVPNLWNLPAVKSPGEQRPGTADLYPYLARYGYS
jgi:FkbM family methyltransferase